MTTAGAGCARRPGGPRPSTIARALAVLGTAFGTGLGTGLTAALAPAPLRAQPARPDSAIITVTGRGPTTYVLLSGLAGGVAGYQRLQRHLLAHGCRVVVIDAYRLSLDSADVSFTALARRVDGLLAAYSVDSARVVGHAHGAGVALRLTANAPRRVSALYFLDVGALGVNRTKVFSASLRLAPLIARMPGGRGFVRGRFVRGLRQNAGRGEWLDAATQRAYTEPVLDHLPAVVAMAGRLAQAREPEPVTSVIARVRVPVTVILGDAPHPAAPDPDEVARLAPLGTRVHVERLPGVGHFPHEEAPAVVGQLLLARQHPQ